MAIEAPEGHKWNVQYGRTDTLSPYRHHVTVTLEPARSWCGSWEKLPNASTPLDDVSLDSALAAVEVRNKIDALKADILRDYERGRILRSVVSAVTK